MQTSPRGDDDGDDPIMNTGPVLPRRLEDRNPDVLRKSEGTSTAHANLSLSLSLKHIG